MRLKGERSDSDRKSGEVLNPNGWRSKILALTKQRLLRVLGGQRRQTSRRDCQPMVRARVRVRTQYHIRCGSGCPL